MRQDYRRWIRWLVPFGLTLAGLLIVVAALTVDSDASQTGPQSRHGERIEPPSAQQEALWAAVGLNEAWYFANGYTENPPPAAASPFSSGSGKSSEPVEVPSPIITEMSRLTVVPRDRPIPGGDQSLPGLTGPQGLVGSTAPCGPENDYCEDNDTAATAYGPLELGVAYYAYPDDINDYYFFELSLTATVGVSVTDYAPTSSDGTVALYGPADGDELGPRIDYYGPRGHSSMLLGPHSLAPGKYFIQVYTASSYTTTQLYVLNLTVPSTRYYLPTVVRNYPPNRLPNVPSNPLPADGATDQTVDVKLSWTGGDPDGDSVTYDVFFEANDDTPDALVCDDASSASCDPGSLSYGTHYYWQVVAKDSLGFTTTGPVWDFSTEKPVVKEVRAIWVTRFDWTSSSGPEGPGDIDDIVANVAGAGFNTIFFQVRGTADAYYAPGLEPWSRRLNDGRVLGQDPGWDPLGYMIEQAHARGVQVHAYLNMYPTWLDSTAPVTGTVPEHPFWTWTGAYGDSNWVQWHQDYGAMGLSATSYLWASPGVDGVRDHIVAVASDIASRYNVDGVHLDLVRYASSPYSYDPISNAAAGDVKTPARDQWQRDRVTGLVSRIYSAIKAIRPETRLSAAVWFCYYADGCGYGLSSGYAHYYQDSLGWLEAGVMDGIAPMLYGWQGFAELSTWRVVMQQFQDRNAGRHVYPGIDGGFNSFSEIASRIQVARDAGAAGHAIFSYGAVNSKGYWDDFAAGPYAQPAR